MISSSESESEDDNRGIALIEGLQCPMTTGVLKIKPIVGYDTGLKILSKTLRDNYQIIHQELTRRMLIKLDVENVAHYVEAILS